MREQEITTTIIAIENGEAVDWPVTILYEYDGGIRVNAVYDGDKETLLTDKQWGECEVEAIDHYNGLCDRAQAQAEDQAEMAAESRREERAGW